MTYEEAMQAIRRNNNTATRDATGFEVAWRFGRSVLLADDSNRHIDYTPTREDMDAADWSVHTP